MKVHVKQCCHSASTTPRFDIGEGDAVLLRNSEGLFFDASIVSVKSKDCIVVSYSDRGNEVIKEISTAEIEAAFLE